MGKSFALLKHIVLEPETINLWEEKEEKAHKSVQLIPFQSGSRRRVLRNHKPERSGNFGAAFPILRAPVHPKVNRVPSLINQGWCAVS